MTAPFRLFGAELSPYSVKVRSYLKFKGLAFEWRRRSAANAEDFARYAKLPLVPLLVDADETVLQDSTPMIEALEAQYPEPSIRPEEPALAFLSALIEDYADEWLNKAMFHYRWSYPADQESAAKRLAEMLFEGAEAPEGVEEAIRARMSGRLHHVGSSPETAPVIEGSFTRLIGMLEAHLVSRPYLFGARPCLADFGLAAQLGQLLSDPTPGAMLRGEAPAVTAWVEQMSAPRADGGFEGFGELAPTLTPLLASEIAGAYLPWMAVNAAAVAGDAPAASVEIAGRMFTQKPQRYAAKAYLEIRKKRAFAADDEALAALLAETGCDAFLEPPTAPRDSADPDDDDGGEEGEEE